MFSFVNDYLLERFRELPYVCSRNNHFELEIVERLRFIGLRGVVARLVSRPLECFVGTLS